MKDIFLISDKKENFNLFYSNLGHLPLHFSWGGSIDEAMQSLPLEKPSFVFLISDNTSLLENWLERIKQKNLSAPVVCFTPYLDVTSREMLWEKGIVELIQLPKHYKEFEYIIKSITLNRDDEVMSGEGQIRGRLQDFSLVDLIQTFGDSGKTGCLCLQKANQKADIQFNRGHVVNAHLKDLEPAEAIKTMSTWTTGNFEMKTEKSLYREYIPLNNQQIITLCIDEIRKRNIIINRLPDVNQKLFAKPDLNYEEIEPIERRLLISFKHGNTISTIMDAFTGNAIYLLERIKKWLSQGVLMDAGAYDSKLQEMKENENRSGIKKVLSKVFTKPSSPELQKKETAINESLSIEEEIAKRLTRRNHLFSGLNRIDNAIKVLEGKE